MSLLVRVAGLEPARANAQQILMVLDTGAAPANCHWTLASVVSTYSTTPAYKRDYYLARPYG